MNRLAPLLCAAALSCAKAPAPSQPTPPPFGAPYDDLADWHLFADAASQAPNEGLVPYEVISPLFTDYTTKFRFLYLPDGARIGYRDDGVWDLPVGAVLVKTFAFRADVRDEHSPLRLLETRILWHEPDKWEPLTYVWDEAQDGAQRAVAGPTLDATFVGPTGATVHDAYPVPSVPQCKTCHTLGNTGHDGSLNGVVSPLGPKSRQLDRDHDYGPGIGTLNQLDRFAQLGWLTAPAHGPTLVDPFGPAAIDLRVRSYWDGNCAHCHEPGGSASQSALWLDFASTDPAQDHANWGLCKVPTSAGDTCGDTYDVVPGDADHSIMVCRVGSTDPKRHMPRLGGNLIHAEGLALIRAWIQGLNLPPCAAM